MSSDLRIAVVGAGAFGKNHLRVVAESPGAQLAAVVDADAERAQAAAAQYNCLALSDPAELAGKVDAAIVATPTVTHAPIGCALLESGIDVLVEKPIAASLEEAQRLDDTARRHNRILQVGHLERFNPAVTALAKIISVPLFFEIHRLSVFSPRSLDVDVVLDLMIHDLDVVLALAGEVPSEVRAAGIAIMSEKVDIANVRLQFASGCVANLTASRVSTERVRKIRLFQPSQYISLDYEKQQAVAFTVGPNRQIGFQPLAIQKAEPLKLEVEAFLDCVRHRRDPLVNGAAALRALAVASDILAKIQEHLGVVAATLSARA